MGANGTNMAFFFVSTLTGRRREFPARSGTVLERAAEILYRRLRCSIFYWDRAVF